MSVIGAVLQLITVNELEESYMKTWTNAVGRTAKKVPIRLMVLGILFAMLLPFSIKTHMTWQTLLGPPTTLVVTVYVLMLGHGIYKYLFALFVAVDEAERHAPISIPKEEMVDLANKYFEDNPETF